MYTMKDPTVEAYQITVDTRDEEQWPEWLQEARKADPGHPGTIWPRHFPKKIADDTLIVQTHDRGSVWLSNGDWVVKTATGKFSVFTNTQFQETFQSV